MGVVEIVSITALGITAGILLWIIHIISRNDDVNEERKDGLK